jgi:2-polyprenyl-3-methyl-5-hydroxy-6-metoxy-1,4-benzoquinol methylase
MFRQKRASEQEIFEYYRNTYYGEWGGDQEGSLRQEIYLDAFRFLEEHGKKGVLLDIGAGSGALLSLARNRGWKIVGQEISIESCRMAKMRHGLELINVNLRHMDWEICRFDAITMVNVLDHLPEPWWVLPKAFNALKKGGIVYLRVPNGYVHSRFYRVSDALPIKSLKEKLRKYLVLHLYHLTPRFLERVLKDSGFGSILIQNSKVSRGSRYPYFSAGERLWFYMMKKASSILPKVIYELTRRRMIVSPSVNVYGFKDCRY